MSEVDSKRLPQEDLERARRKIKRRAGAVLVRGMAETDTGFDLMAARLGTTEEEVRTWLYSFIECTTDELDIVSDLCLAMDAELEFHMQRLPSTLSDAGESKDNTND